MKGTSVFTTIKEMLFGVDIPKGSTGITVLESARKLLSDERHWTKGNYAVNKNGQQPPYSELHKADKWCTVGALMVTNADGAQAIRDARAALYTTRPFHQMLGLFDTNDASEMTHEILMDWFDRAIAYENNRLKEVAARQAEALVV
jgi:hypothetical protein